MHDKRKVERDHDEGPRRQKAMSEKTVSAEECLCRLRKRPSYPRLLALMDEADKKLTKHEICQRLRLDNESDADFLQWLEQSPPSEVDDASKLDDVPPECKFAFHPPIPEDVVDPSFHLNDLVDPILGGLLTDFVRLRPSDKQLYNWNVTKARGSKDPLTKQNWPEYADVTVDLKEKSRLLNALKSQWGIHYNPSSPSEKPATTSWEVEAPEQLEEEQDEEEEQDGGELEAMEPEDLSLVELPPPPVIPSRNYVATMLPDELIPLILTGEEKGTLNSLLPPYGTGVRADTKQWNTAIEELKASFQHSPTQEKLAILTASSYHPSVIQSVQNLRRIQVVASE